MRPPSALEAKRNALNKSIVTVTTTTTTTTTTTWIRDESRFNVEVASQKYL